MWAAVGDPSVTGMSWKNLSRALLSAVLIALGLALPLATTAPARAIGAANPSLTVGIAGYGAVTATGMTDCRSTAGTGSGTEVDCATVDPTFAHCTTTSDPDGTSSSWCEVTLTAAPVDPAGWAFDHWSGDCSGTTATCTVLTEESDCDPQFKPVCRTTAYDVTAVAAFRDTRAPVTQLTSGPPASATNWTDSRSATFGFGSTNESGEITRSECQFGGLWVTCLSPFTWNAIPDGVHTFCVRQYDASGLLGSPACRTWEQESPIVTRIDASPAGTTTDADSDLSLAFSTSKSSHASDGSRYEYRCALDGDPLAVCPETVTEAALPNGTHTMRLVTRFYPVYGDPMDGQTTTYTWTQDDLTAPTLAFAHPSGQIATGDPDLDYTIDDPLAKVACTVDGHTVGCDRGSADVPTTAGVHALTIDVRDSVGNLNSYQWTWDREEAPVTTITSGPAEAATTSGGTAGFGLAASLAGSTFACDVDGRGWAPCSDPAGAETLTGLTPGGHALAVRATYHSPLGGTLDGPVVGRHWSVAAPAAPRCTVQVKPRLRSHRVRLTTTCTQDGTARVRATVRIGSRPLTLAHGRVPLTAGHASTVGLKVRAATWRRLVHGHHYRVKVQVRMGQVSVGHVTTRVHR
jgi:hypothetical protein